MTIREAAIVSAYTGTLIGTFSAMQQYLDEKLGYSTFTHMYASEEFCEMVKKATKDDFVAIKVVR